MTDTVPSPSMPRTLCRLFFRRWRVQHCIIRMGWFPIGTEAKTIPVDT